MPSIKEVNARLSCSTIDFSASVCSFLSYVWIDYASVQNSMIQLLLSHLF